MTVAIQTQKTVCIPRLWSPLALLAAAGLALGCGDDGGAAGGPDAGANPDAATPDASAEPDAMAGCDPRTALPAQWRPIAMVSAGEVVTAVDGAVTTASVDASAGGMASAADNPYIYVDLESGAKVDINDVESFSSTDWDIALKRSSVRANGGDSGPGDVAVSMVEAASLDEVTELPGADTFVTDDWTDDDCAFVSGFGGEPATGVGNWYDYDLETHELTPFEQVFVVRTHSGEHVKLRIVTWYGNDEMPEEGGYYQLEWESF